MKELALVGTQLLIKKYNNVDSFTCYLLEEISSIIFDVMPHEGYQAALEGVNRLDLSEEIQNILQNEYKLELDKTQSMKEKNNFGLKYIATKIKH